MPRSAVFSLRRPLSLQIKALEQELALKLFDHKGRKLELTPQGEIFYVEARKVLNSV